MQKTVRINNDGFTGGNNHITYKDGDITISLESNSVKMSLWNFTQALKKLGIKRIPKTDNECPMEEWMEEN